MWPALITGGASLLGSMFGNSTSASNTQAQIQAQQQMQQQTMDWNEKMSNTAYQRASADMQQAGLNPAMMFSSGSAASSPQMSPQQVPVAQNRGALSGIGEAVGQAVNTAVTMKTLDKMTQEIANLRVQEAKTEADTQLTKQSTATEVNETQRRANEAALSGLRMPGARVSARESEAIEKLPDWVRDSLSIGAYGGGKAADTLRPISDIVSSARAIRGLMPSRSTREVTHSDGHSTFEEMWHNRAH